MWDDQVPGHDDLVPASPPGLQLVMGPTPVPGRIFLSFASSRHTDADAPVSLNFSCTCHSGATAMARSISSS